MGERYRKRNGQICGNLCDVLPVQERYYLLSDLSGLYKYSRFGKGSSNGLLVFTDAESATRFCESVAWPAMDRARGIRPIVTEVTADEMLHELDEAGAVCRVEGTRIKVGKIFLSGGE